jgi:hypothetical protein
MSVPPIIAAVSTPAPDSSKWYQRIPALVSLATCISFEGMSAFAGVLSQRFQVWGFCISVGIGLLAGIFFCVYVGWQAHQNGEKQNSVIAMGAIIAIALFGMSFFHFSSDPRVKFFADDTNTQAAQLPLTGPVITGSSINCPPGYNVFYKLKGSGAQIGMYHGCNRHDCIVDADMSGSVLKAYEMPDCPKQ